MSAQMDRIVLRTAQSARREIQELLAGVLSAELVAPSRKLWLISPWLRDVPLLDNRSGAFQGVGPGWARKEISLFEILGELARRGSRLIVATRTGKENQKAHEALRHALGNQRAEKRLTIHRRPKLHSKGLLGEGYCISGSMNFTHNGIEHLEEMITYTRDPARVGRLRIEFDSEFGEDP
jgi:phosphatidylserine/phosphatidylglycerophosphate/cardiolipin synthase-like enzyme